jgi:transporter family protein
MTQHWLTWAILSATFAAATTILSKVGVRDAHPDAAQLVRTAVVLVAVVGLIASTGRWRQVGSLSRTNLTYLTLAGLATAASWVCYYRALAAGDASRVAVVDKLSVPLVALAAVALLGERLGALGWLGIALAAVGATLVTFDR